MRVLKDRARFRPQRGSRRVFLIDHLDRANEAGRQLAAKDPGRAARSPHPGSHRGKCPGSPAHHPLARCTASPRPPFLRRRWPHIVGPRGLDQPERRIRLAAGSPGQAVSLDLEEYDRRKTAMFGPARSRLWRNPLRRMAGACRCRGGGARREARIVFVGFIRPAAGFAGRPAVERGRAQPGVG